MTTAAQRRTGRSQPPEPTGEPIFYPYSDGEPMGESQPHVDAIRVLLDALDDLFWDDETVSVHGNVHWYWREGDPRRNRVPDAMIIPGVPMDRTRQSFKSWEHGGAIPSAIIEVVSYDTWRDALGPIHDDYEENGVREYFVFDPSGRYLDAPLLGFRLSRRRYRDLKPAADGSIVSRGLNVRLRPVGQSLRLVDLHTGEPVPTRPERIAEQQAEIERLHHLLELAGIDPATK